MTDEKAWFTEVAGRKVTTVEIAEILGVTRRTATSRLAAGLSSDELITISLALGLSPIHSLIELDRITYGEALDLLEGKGTLVETADPGYLALELARQLNPPARQSEIETIAAGRDDHGHPETPVDNVHQLPTRSNNSGADVTALPYSADSSPEEPEEGDDGYHDGP